MRADSRRDDVTEDELEALQSIRSTYADLDRWRARSRGVERPERGSELAADEAIWPYLDPAEVARQSLVSASQHLNLARAALEAGEVFPTAHFSVLRGALVGSSMAVWVLEPDVAVDRQQRVLRIVDEFYKRALQYHDEIRPYVDESHPDAAEWLDSGAHLRRRRAEARARWASGDGLKERQALDMTGVVGVVAASVFKPAESLDVRLLWRQLSGDAHALTWQLAGRSSPVRSVGAGMAEFAAGGNLALLADAFGKLYRLTKRGWSLFDRRCESLANPVSGA